MKNKSKLTRLTAISIIIGCLCYTSAFAIDCPAIPKQTNNDWDVEVQAAVAKIGSIKGGDIQAHVKNTTQDLFAKLPNADKVYLEQMMFATWCSGVRDDKTLTEAARTQMVKKYKGGVLEANVTHASKSKKTAIKEHVNEETSKKENNTIGSIVTNNQSGGSNTIINQAPKPELRQLTSDEEPVQNRDGTFTYLYDFEWTAQFPNVWRVTACGDGVKDTTILPPPTGHAGLRGSCAFADLRNPLGRYTVQITTTKRTKLVLKHGLPDDEFPKAGDRIKSY